MIFGKVKIFLKNPKFYERMYFRDIFDFWKVLKIFFFFIIIYDSWPGNPSKSLLLKSTILGLKALEIYLKKKIKNFLALKYLKNIFQKFSLKLKLSKIKVVENHYKNSPFLNRKCLKNNLKFLTKKSLSQK